MSNQTLRGLSVRWSLTGTDEELAARLREYVAGPSYEKFSGMPGLSTKTWRMRAGEWFEGTYVFSSATARADFQETFTAGAEQAPVSVMVGGGPVLVEAFEVLALAEGGDGFVPGP